MGNDFSVILSVLVTPVQFMPSAVWGNSYMKMLYAVCLFAALALSGCKNEGQQVSGRYTATTAGLWTVPESIDFTGPGICQLNYKKGTYPATYEPKPGGYLITFTDATIFARIEGGGLQITVGSDTIT